MDANKKWMSSGKIGCSFAAMFSRNPELVGWVTLHNPKLFSIPKDCCILSLQFDGMNKKDVLNWALSNGFYTEDLGDKCTGLRYNIGDKIAWVQYFGPDSHVVTRRSPIAELCMCVKLPVHTYAKVGVKGVLHLAHASVKGLSQLVQDKLWNSSFVNTEKRLNKKPTLIEAAKTTYHE